MDFCMPVKLFEYLSRGLPVVTTRCKETAQFVTENGFGVVSDGTPEAFAQAVVSLFDDPAKMRALRENAISVLKSRNLWQHRAQKAAEEILGK